jgi:transcriptional regulator with XRE-family HTH domain
MPFLAPVAHQSQRCSIGTAALYHDRMVKLTRLKEVRQRKALTQQQLAEKAGVNRVTIARIEGGKDEPFPTTLRKVADALGVEPDELLAPPAETLANGPTSGHGANVTLDERITVRDEPEVRRLLQAHPDLAAMIQEAAEQLVRFIPDARLTLEVVVDPEYGDDEELLLWATTRLPPLEALAALDRFDDAWWLHNARRAHGLFFVNVR